MSDSDPGSGRTKENQNISFWFFCMRRLACALQIALMSGRMLAQQFQIMVRIQGLAQAL